MVNQDVGLTLDSAVAEVLALLTGMDLKYDPDTDRYAVITRMLNRALRDNALETDWSYYASTEDVGLAIEGRKEIFLRSSVRPRIIRDDAVVLSRDGVPHVWAYFLPRDALSKYANSRELKAAVTRTTLSFSRPFSKSEAGMHIEVPVMREPRMFRLPEQPESPDAELIPVPDDVREQQVDFDYPDIIVTRAAFLTAQTDPLMQPRVQTLEMQFKDLMYQLIERDDRHTDTPYQNEFILPISNDIYGREDPLTHGHPHSETGRLF